MRRVVLGLIRRFWLRWSRKHPLEPFQQLLSGYGIGVFVGPNGSGKSLAAVASLLPTLAGQSWECDEATHRHHGTYQQHLRFCETCPPAAVVARLARQQLLEGSLCERGAEALEIGRTGKRLAYSTVVLLDPETGEEHPLYRPLLDYSQLVTIEHAVVLFDEVAGVADAGDSGAIPVQVVQWMHTLRKVDVRLLVTTPAYARCAKPIRQVAQVVVDCRSFCPEPATDGRIWRSRQAFILKAYNAFDFEDFTAGTRERLDRLGWAVMWRPGHEAERTYDTLSPVAMLGHVNEAGLCTHCGGRRSAPRCACPTVLPDADTFTVEENVSASGSRVRRAVPVG